MKNLIFFGAIFLLSGRVSAQVIVAHFNGAAIMDSLPSFAEMKRRIIDFETNSRAELDSMITDFERYVHLSTGGGCFGTEQRQLNEEKLVQKEQDIRSRYEALPEELKAYSDALSKPILDRIQLALKNVSDRENYNYVFDITDLLIYNGPDITQEIIAEALRLEEEAAEVVKP